MRNKTSTTLIFLSVLLIVSSAVKTRSQTTNSLFQGEKFVIRSLKRIHAAQMTYGPTYGNGHFATTLEALRQAGLIDAVLASGKKYGYTFAMSVTSSPSTYGNLFLTATPQSYPKTGKRSFFMDTLSELRGGDKNGQVATVSDPFIDSCALWGSAENERCTIQAVRMLHGAEMTYASTYGNGNYGSLAQMGETHLIYTPLATGLMHGYRFTVNVIVSTLTIPAQFKINAVPQIYGTTGVLSFFMDTGGVLRGADKHGEPATENDPVIETCTNGSIAENEQCTVQSLRTLHGAEMTYASTYGNGYFCNSRAELASIGFINTQLGSGQLHGYSIAVFEFHQTLSDPATFSVTATPQRYGMTGMRSFFIATDGVILGADKHGRPANENDPPITF